MTCGGEEEINPHRESTDAGQSTAKRDTYGNSSDKGCENNRVREPAMTPKVTVSDAEMKSNDIKIGNDRTECANRPDSLWNLRRVKAGSNTESSYRMRNY